jgi:hypothetical protein
MPTVMNCPEFQGRFFRVSVAQECNLAPSFTTVTLLPAAYNPFTQLPD